MIVLIGATGFTGRLIAQELKRSGCPVRLAGRDRPKVEELRDSISSRFETASVDVTDPASIAAAIKGARVVISCAGPFTDVGEAVVREAVREGVHYLDTTGEQGFIRMVFERYAEPARKKGVALVPACAFEYALGDTAAALGASGMAACQEIDVIYSIEGMASSRGTRKSVIRAIAAPGFLLRSNVPVEFRTGALSTRVDLPPHGRRRAYSFPGGEVFLVPLHLRAADITTSMVYPVPLLVMKLFSIIGPSLMRSALADWFLRRIDKGQFGPTWAQRAATRFTILCLVRGDARSRRVVVQGTDPYGLTAVVAARVAEVMGQNEFNSGGALSPAMVGGPELIRSCTEGLGAKWAVDDQ
jgi:short subunit dehydrogenase-like uncharacterized protein